MELRPPLMLSHTAESTLRTRSLTQMAMVLMVNKFILRILTRRLSSIHCSNKTEEDFTSAVKEGKKLNDRCSNSRQSGGRGRRNILYVTIAFS